MEHSLVVRTFCVCLILLLRSLARPCVSEQSMNQRNVKEMSEDKELSSFEKNFHRMTNQTEIRTRRRNITINNNNELIAH